MSRTFWLALLGLLLPGSILIYGTNKLSTGVVVALIGPFYTFGLSAFNLAPNLALPPLGYITRIGLTFWDPTIFFDPSSFTKAASAQSGINQQAINIQSTLLYLSGNPAPTSFTLSLGAILMILSTVFVLIGLILTYYGSRRPMNTVFQIYISFFTFILFVVAAAAQLASVEYVTGFIASNLSATYPVAFGIPFGMVFVFAAAITSLYEPHVPQSGKIRWLSHFVLIGVLFHLSYGLQYLQSADLIRLITLQLTNNQVYQIYDLILGLIGLPMIYSVYNLKTWGRIYGLFELGFNTLVNLILSALFFIFQFPLLTQFGYYDNNFVFEILSTFVSQLAISSVENSLFILSLAAGFLTIFLPSAYFMVYIYKNKIMFVHK